MWMVVGKLHTRGYVVGVRWTVTVSGYSVVLLVCVGLAQGCGTVFDCMLVPFIRCGGVRVRVRRLVCVCG